MIVSYSMTVVVKLEEAVKSMTMMEVELLMLMEEEELCSLIKV